jgi:hypothetical protein
MFRRILILLAATLVGAVLTANPAQAATYSVSIAISAPKGDVGTYVTISGSVSGSKAAKKTVQVQRLVGAGSWTTIASIKTSSTKKYSYKHKISVVGGQLFRVVAPKNGSTHTGTSATRAFTGWNWLWLSEQPHFSNGPVRVGATTTLLGSKYPHSIEIYPSPTSDTSVTWNVLGLCDTSDVKLGTFTEVGVKVTNDDGNIVRLVTSSALVPVDTVRSFTDWVQFQNTYSEGYAWMLSPRVHCSVTVLPEPDI